MTKIWEILNERIKQIRNMNINRDISMFNVILSSVDHNTADLMYL